MTLDGLEPFDCDAPKQVAYILNLLKSQKPLDFQFCFLSHMLFRSFFPHELSFNSFVYTLQNPRPLPYLAEKVSKIYDISLEVLSRCSLRT